MRKIVVLLIIVVIFPLFTVDSKADEQVDEYISEFDNILPDELKDVGTDADMLMDMASIKGLISSFFSVAKENGEGIKAFFFTVVAVSLLSSLVSLPSSELSSVADGTVGMISSFLIYRVISPMFASISSSLEELNTFFSSLIPISAGLIALGGGTASAGVQAGGMYTALSVLGSISEGAFSAFLTLGLAFALISSFSDDGMTAVCKGVKGAFSWFLGIFCGILAAAVSLQTTLASATDSASIRAAKYLASSIPMVGSTVSGALSTLASGIVYAKGIVGVGSIIAILSLIISPLVMLLCYRGVMSVGLILTDFLGSKTASRIFSSYRFALNMLIAVYASAGVIYVLEIILFLKIGVMIL